MSQTFNLRLATESIAINAQQLGVTIALLQRIRVYVVAIIIRQPKPYLWLTYQIELPHPCLAAQLNWPAWQPAQVGFSDYLWEQTCLECFIQTTSISTANAVDISSIGNGVIEDGQATDYIEINASPSGRYALYQFNSYRNPSTLPPNPLLRTDGRTRARIDWADSSSQNKKLVISKLNPAPTLCLTTVSTILPKSIFTPNCHYKYGKSFYERGFGIPLAQLSNQTSIIDPIPIERLHPCVILWFGELALYFASSHASPPDFHQREYWSPFDYKAALAQ
ncbi:hypothetical protein RCH20_000476 [Psychrobacter sp. PL15]|uniref:hypothetical protein n=1 Tax=Psychrobacter sp. PL15 TaxID=3071719 RepID=UPI002DFCC9AB|nr:hypothetical protein [Psychrobacter sp. PL15]